MQVSLILYAEHEFNASTFTARVIAGTGSDLYSCICGAIGALKGPKHGGANEVALVIQQRYATPDEAEADIRRRVANHEVVIGFGHPVYTISDPRSDVIKKLARALAVDAEGQRLFSIAERIESTMHDAKRMFPNLDWYLGRGLSPDGHSRGTLHADFCDGANRRLGRARHRAAPGRQDHPPLRRLYWPGES